MFVQLIGMNMHGRMNCIVVTARPQFLSLSLSLSLSLWFIIYFTQGGGYPDIVTRLLVHELSATNKLPVFVHCVCVCVCVCLCVCVSLSLSLSLSLSVWVCVHRHTIAHSYSQAPRTHQ